MNNISKMLLCLSVEKLLYCVLWFFQIAQIVTNYSVIDELISKVYILHTVLNRFLSVFIVILRITKAESIRVNSAPAFLPQESSHLTPKR